MSDNVMKKYVIEIDAKIDKAEETINKLEKQMEGFAKDKALAQSITSQIDSAKKSIADLKSFSEKSFKGLQQSINKLDTSKINKQFDGVTRQLDASISKIEKQVELLSSVINTSDTGKLDQFVVKLTKPFADLTIAIENATEALNSFNNVGFNPAINQKAVQKTAANIDTLVDSINNLKKVAKKNNVEIFSDVGNDEKSILAIQSAIEQVIMSAEGLSDLDVTKTLTSHLGGSLKALKNYNKRLSAEFNEIVGYVGQSRGDYNTSGVKPLERNITVKYTLDKENSGDVDAIANEITDNIIPKINEKLAEKEAYAKILVTADAEKIKSRLKNIVNQAIKELNSEDAFSKIEVNFGQIDSQIDDLITRLTNKFKTTDITANVSVGNSTIDNIDILAKDSTLQEIKQILSSGLKVVHGDATTISQNLSVPSSGQEKKELGFSDYAHGRRRGFIQRDLQSMAKHTSDNLRTVDALKTGSKDISTITKALKNSSLTMEEVLEQVEQTGYFKQGITLKDKEGKETQYSRYAGVFNKEQKPVELSKFQEELKKTVAKAKEQVEQVRLDTAKDFDAIRAGKYTIELVDKVFKTEEEANAELQKILHSKNYTKDELKQIEEANLSSGVVEAVAFRNYQLGTGLKDTQYKIQFPEKKIDWKRIVKEQIEKSQGESAWLTKSGDFKRLLTDSQMKNLLYQSVAKRLGLWDDQSGKIIKDEAGINIQSIEQELKKSGFIDSNKKITTSGKEIAKKLSPRFQQAQQFQLEAQNLIEQDYEQFQKEQDEIDKQYQETSEKYRNASKKRAEFLNQLAQEHQSEISSIDEDIKTLEDLGNSLEKSSDGENVGTTGHNNVTFKGKVVNYQEKLEELRTRREEILATYLPNNIVDEFLSAQKEYESSIKKSSSHVYNETNITDALRRVINNRLNTLLAQVDESNSLTPGYEEYLKEAQKEATQAAIDSVLVPLTQIKDDFEQHEKSIKGEYKAASNKVLGKTTEEQFHKFGSLLTEIPAEEIYRDYIRDQLQVLNPDAIDTIIKQLLDKTFQQTARTAGDSEDLITPYITGINDIRQAVSTLTDILQLSYKEQYEGLSEEQKLWENQKNVIQQIQEYKSKGQEIPESLKKELALSDALVKDQTKLSELYDRRAQIETELIAAQRTGDLDATKSATQALSKLNVEVGNLDRISVDDFIDKNLDDYLEKVDLELQDIYETQRKLTSSARGIANNIFGNTLSRLTSAKSYEEAVAQYTEKSARLNKLRSRLKPTTVVDEKTNKIKTVNNFDALTSFEAQEYRDLSKEIAGLQTVINIYNKSLVESKEKTVAATSALDEQAKKLEVIGKYGSIYNFEGLEARRTSQGIDKATEKEVDILSKGKITSSIWKAYQNTATEIGNYIIEEQKLASNKTQDIRAIQSKIKNKTEELSSIIPEQTMVLLNNQFEELDKIENTLSQARKQAQSEIEPLQEKITNLQSEYNSEESLYRLFRDRLAKVSHGNKRSVYFSETAKQTGKKHQDPIFTKFMPQLETYLSSAMKDIGITNKDKLSPTQYLELDKYLYKQLAKRRDAIEKLTYQVSKSQQKLQTPEIKGLEKQVVDITTQISNLFNEAIDSAIKPIQEKISELRQNNAKIANNNADIFDQNIAYDNIVNSDNNPFKKLSTDELLKQKEKWELLTQQALKNNIDDSIEAQAKFIETSINNTLDEYRKELDKIEVKIQKETAKGDQANKGYLNKLFQRGQALASNLYFLGDSSHNISQQEYEQFQVETSVQNKANKAQEELLNLNQRSTQIEKNIQAELEQRLDNAFGYNKALKQLSSLQFVREQEDQKLQAEINAGNLDSEQALNSKKAIEAIDRKIIQAESQIAKYEKEKANSIEQAVINDVRLLRISQDQLADAKEQKKSVSLKIDQLRANQKADTPEYKNLVDQSNQLTNDIKRLEATIIQINKNLSHDANVTDNALLEDYISVQQDINRTQKRISKLSSEDEQSMSARAHWEEILAEEFEDSIKTAQNEKLVTQKNLLLVNEELKSREQQNASNKKQVALTNAATKSKERQNKVVDETTTILEKLREEDKKQWLSRTNYRTPDQQKADARQKEWEKQNAYRYAGLNDYELKKVRQYNSLNSRLQNGNQISPKVQKDFDILSDIISKFSNIVIDEKGYASSRITKEEFEAGGNKYITNGYLAKLFDISKNKIDDDGALATEKTLRSILEVLSKYTGIKTNNYSGKKQNNGEESDYQKLKRVLGGELGVVNQKGKFKGKRGTDTYNSNAEKFREEAIKRGYAVASPTKKSKYNINVTDQGLDYIKQHSEAIKQDTKATASKTQSEKEASKASKDWSQALYKNVAKDNGLLGKSGKVSKDNRDAVYAKMQDLGYIDDKHKLTEAGKKAANALEQNAKVVNNDTQRIQELESQINSLNEEILNNQKIISEITNTLIDNSNIDKQQSEIDKQIVYTKQQVLDKLKSEANLTGKQAETLFSSANFTKSGRGYSITEDQYSNLLSQAKQNEEVEKINKVADSAKKATVEVDNLKHKIIELFNSKDSANSNDLNNLLGLTNKKDISFMNSKFVEAMFSSTTNEEKANYLYDAYKSLGKQADQAVADGIAENASVISDATKKSVQQGVVDTSKEVLDEHSPSKTAEQIGLYYVKGLSQGIEKGVPGVIQAVKNALSAAEISEKDIDELLKHLNSHFSGMKRPDAEKMLGTFGTIKNNKSIKNKYTNDLSYSNLLNALKQYKNPTNPYLGQSVQDLEKALNKENNLIEKCTKSELKRNEHLLKAQQITEALTVANENLAKSEEKVAEAEAKSNTQKEQKVKLSAREKYANDFDPSVATEKQLKRALGRYEDAKTLNRPSEVLAWKPKIEAIQQRLNQIDAERKQHLEEQKQILLEIVKFEEGQNASLEHANNIAESLGLHLDDIRNVSVKNTGLNNIWSFQSQNQKYSVREFLDDDDQLQYQIVHIEELNNEYTQLQNTIKGLSGVLNKYGDISNYLPTMFGNLAPQVKEAQQLIADLTNIKNNGTADNIKDITDKVDRLKEIALQIKGKNGIVGVIAQLTEAETNSVDARKKSLADLALQYADGEIQAYNFAKSNSELTYSVRTADDQLKVYAMTIDQTGQVTQRLISQTKYVGTLGKLFQSFGKKFGELIRYTTASLSFWRVINMIKSGVNVVKELDTAMTEMQKVSNDTQEALDRFAASSHKMAQEIGSTAAVIQNSAADWLRLGYNIKEAADLSKNTAILMNVSEFESIDAATESMVAMVQAFKDTNKDVGDLSLEIIDKLNNIGNNFSISTSDLAKSLQRSSGALIAAGNNLDEAIALTTAANAIIQDPESTGSALKVISMRLRGTSVKELEEAGEDTEGVIETVSKLEAKIKELTAINGQLGISILDANGNYRDTYEILQDIADIWEEIGEADKRDGQNRQAALLEAMAGKTRSQSLASLLQNPDMLRQVYEASKVSEGSAQKENEKYLDSIEAHVQILTAKWQEFWNSTLNRKQINAVLDLAGKLLDIATKLGSIPTASILLGGGISLKRFANKRIGQDPLGLQTSGRNKKPFLVIAGCYSSLSWDTSLNIA